MVSCDSSLTLWRHSYLLDCTLLEGRVHSNSCLCLPLLSPGTCHSALHTETINECWVTNLTVVFCCSSSRKSRWCLPHSGAAWSKHSTVTVFSNHVVNSSHTVRPGKETAELSTAHKSYFVRNGCPSIMYLGIITPKI